MAKTTKARTQSKGRTTPETPAQPHDVLAKKIFGNPQNARVELQAVLPAELVSAIDWSTLEVLPDTFIRPAFAKTQADLLFRVKIAGREARIYVLFEHKSDAKPETLVQVGGYVMDALSRYFEQQGKLPAPVVIPVVLHHSEHGWTVAQRFHELFDEAVLAIPGVREHVPDFWIALDDVSQLDDVALRARAQDAATLIVPLTLWALRDGRRGDAILVALRYWAQVIAILWQIPSARDGLFFVLHYLTRINEALTEQDLFEALGEAAPEAKEAIMTLAEQWMAQGEAKGVAKGRVEGERRVLERQLRRKFGADAVDDSVLSRLAAASEEQLAEWADRVLDAETLEKLFS